MTFSNHVLSYFKGVLSGLLMITKSFPASKAEWALDGLKVGPKWVFVVAPPVFTHISLSGNSVRWFATLANRMWTV